MKYVKLKYVLAVFSLLFFAMIIWNFLNMLSFTDSGINFEGKSRQEKFYPNSPIIQKMKAEKNNFSQINVSIKKFSPKLGDKIVLEVMDEDCQNILAKSQIGRWTWYSPTYQKFKFKPLSDSQGKSYCLKFNYVPAEKEQKKKSYISSYSLEGFSYINTGKSIEEQKNQSLGLKLAYEDGSHWKNISHLTDRMSQYKPVFLKGYFLEILFIISFVLIILTVIAIIFII